MVTDKIDQSVSTIDVETAGGKVCVIVIAGGRVEVVEVEEITVKGTLTLGVDVGCPPDSVNT